MPFLRRPSSETAQTIALLVGGLVILNLAPLGALWYYAKTGLAPRSIPAYGYALIPVWIGGGGVVGYFVGKRDRQRLVGFAVGLALGLPGSILILLTPSRWEPPRRGRSSRGGRAPRSRPGTPRAPLRRSKRPRA